MGLTLLTASKDRRDGGALPLLGRLLRSAELMWSARVWVILQTRACEDSLTGDSEEAPNQGYFQQSPKQP